MPRACVFCGRTPVTSEHVIPKWIGDLFPGRGPGTAQIIRSGGEIISFPTEFFAQKVNAVCAVCNNEWMSDVEGLAKPSLSNMIRHQGQIKLRPPTSKKLATWAVKTALMLQYINPGERTVPDSEYASLYTLKQPSISNIVLVGYRSDLRDRTGVPAIVKSSQQVITRFNADSDPELFEWAARGRRAYRSLFAIGHVVFAFIGHDFPGGIRFGHSRTDVLKALWPIQGRTYWPPPVPIGDVGGFEAVFEGLGGPPFPPI